MIRSIIDYTYNSNRTLDGEEDNEETETTPLYPTSSISPINSNLTSNDDSNSSNNSNDGDDDDDDESPSRPNLALASNTSTSSEKFYSTLSFEVDDGNNDDVDDDDDDDDNLSYGPDDLLNNNKNGKSKSEDDELLSLSSIDSTSSNNNNNNNNIKTNKSIISRKDDLRESTTIFKTGLSDTSSDDEDDIKSKITQYEDDLYNETIDVKKLGIAGTIFHREKKAIKVESRNHIQVLFQFYGSVWPSVFPFCVINVIWTYCIWFIDNKSEFINLSIPSQGHSFLSILVAFLVVTRVNIIYQRFNEARNHLGMCFHCATDLMNYVSLLSMNCRGEKAKLWRVEVATKIVFLMRIMIAAIEFSSTEDDPDPWESIPMNSLDRTLIQRKCTTYYRDGMYSNRNMADEARSVPIVYASTLRKELLLPRYETDILDDGSGVPGSGKLNVVDEMKLLSYVTNFISSYHGLTKLITTPFPFPLVQKTQTILYFWVFTLPQALMNVNVGPYQTMIVIFFITFGFFGLEFVSKELSDPFGSDPNDFNTMRFALRAYEDIYTTIFLSDGKKYADEMHHTCSPDVAPIHQNLRLSDSSLKLSREQSNTSAVTFKEDEIASLPPSSKRDKSLRSLRPTLLTHQRSPSNSSNVSGVTFKDDVVFSTPHGDLKA